MKKYLLVLSLFTLHLFADTTIPPLSDMMSIEVQKKTGVIRLKQYERKELAKWLSENCFAHKKEIKEPTDTSQYLQVVLNIDSGKKLQLTDNSIWEIDPNDVRISSGWLSDISVKIYPSGDNQYPFLIVNQVTKKSVKARKSSTL